MEINKKSLDILVSFIVLPEWTKSIQVYEQKRLAKFVTFGGFKNPGVPE